MGARLPPLDLSGYIQGMSWAAKYTFEGNQALAQGIEQGAQGAVAGVWKRRQFGLEQQRVGLESKHLDIEAMAEESRRGESVMRIIDNDNWRKMQAMSYMDPDSLEFAQAKADLDKNGAIAQTWAQRLSANPLMRARVQASQPQAGQAQGAATGGVNQAQAAVDDYFAKARPVGEIGRPPASDAIPIPGTDAHVHADGTVHANGQHGTDKDGNPYSFSAPGAASAPGIGQAAPADSDLASRLAVEAEAHRHDMLSKQYAQQAKDKQAELLKARGLISGAKRLQMQTEITRLLNLSTTEGADPSIQDAKEATAERKNELAKDRDANRQIDVERRERDMLDAREARLVEGYNKSKNAGAFKRLGIDPSEPDFTNVDEFKARTAFATRDTTQKTAIDARTAAQAERETFKEHLANVHIDAQKEAAEILATANEGKVNLAANERLLSKKVDTVGKIRDDARVAWEATLKDYGEGYEKRRQAAKDKYDAAAERAAGMAAALDEHMHGEHGAAAPPAPAKVPAPSWVKPEAKADWDALTADQQADVIKRAGTGK